MNKVEIGKRVRQMLIESEQPKKIAAGVLIQCTKTNKILLLLRAGGGVGAHTWNLVAGGIEKGEDVLDGLKREVTEEMSIDPDIIDYKYKNKEVDDKLDFYYYEGFTPTEFKPTLCDENVDWKWVSKDELPSPLFPNIQGKIDKI